MKAHHDLHIESRNKAIVARRQHNPMVVVLNDKNGNPRRKAKLDEELEIARKALGRAVRRFAKGEIQEITLKKAEYGYLKLIKKSSETAQRRKETQRSVEFCEGKVQSGEIFIDIAVLAMARMRRVS